MTSVSDNANTTFLNSGGTAQKGRDAREAIPPEGYTKERFEIECRSFLAAAAECESLEDARQALVDLTVRLRIKNSMMLGAEWDRAVDRTRDCARAMLGVLSAASDEKAGFSVSQALWDMGKGRPRADLGAGFYAEIIHVVWGLEGRSRGMSSSDLPLRSGELSGREAALVRSDELDRLWAQVESRMNRYEQGLSASARARRAARRDRIVERLGGRLDDWSDWRWHVKHVGKDLETLEGLVGLSEEERRNIGTTCRNRIPFGVTPYYLSLMDEQGSDRDRAIRAQVFPPRRYVEEMTQSRDKRHEAFDFMQERDTSPVDLITRRYPGIVILKPYNTCPQICVYCQRNWEIDEVLADDAMAPWDKIEEAVRWIGDHPAIHDVLITGGDPLLLENHELGRLLKMVADVPSVKRIRIGTRTPVTLPMRFTKETAELLGSFREPGVREVCVVTHVEHPYEITPETVTAVDRLRRQGIGVYNQLVYTFFVSRRFEASLLRVTLRQAGIDPYYTFLPKGKDETDDYRVPLSRLLQEQTEEARLLPGQTRTDEAVYNVPRLGKNYLRASNYRDLLSFLPDGTRIYQFHPWEKGIADQSSYAGDVVPIVEYLRRIEQLGDDPADYESIWYYY